MQQQYLDEYLEGKDFVPVTEERPNPRNGKRLHIPIHKIQSPFINRGNSLQGGELLTSVAPDN